MFPGFPPEALTFFRSLARNNNREWFQPRKELFENRVKAPMIALVEAINAELGKFAPEYIADSKKAVSAFPACTISARSRLRSRAQRQTATNFPRPTPGLARMRG